MEIWPDEALSEEYKDLYPFSEIVGKANVLVMPGHNSLQNYENTRGAKVIGPLLIGLGI